MTVDATPTRHLGDSCANCGAALNGEFCASCGQSREDIKRPAWSLVTDTLDGLFAWDGRLLTTLRHLYARPGRVAREYADGRRQRYTPPIRLYLIVSLVFFAAMTLSGVRIIAVNTSITEAGPGISLTMFQPAGTSEPIRLSEQERADFVMRARELGARAEIIEIALRAAENPAVVEGRAGSAANQALILMVLVFIILNTILHPRTRVIEHVIHALYYHAAFLPVAAAVLITAILVDLPTVPALILVGVASIATITGYYLFDRGFYGSSWWGALLRSLLTSVVYSVTVIVTALLLIVLATL